MLQPKAKANVDNSRAVQKLRYPIQGIFWPPLFLTSLWRNQKDKPSPLNVLRNLWTAPEIFIFFIIVLSVKKFIEKSNWGFKDKEKAEEPSAKTENL